MGKLLKLVLEEHRRRDTLAHTFAPSPQQIQGDGKSSRSVRRALFRRFPSGTDTPVYDAAEAERHWKAILALFAEELRA